MDAGAGLDAAAGAAGAANRVQAFQVGGRSHASPGGLGAVATGTVATNAAATGAIATGAVATSAAATGAAATGGLTGTAVGRVQEHGAAGRLCFDRR